MRMDGGQLVVEVSEGLDMTLIGTAEHIFDGELAPDFVERLASL